MPKRNLGHFEYLLSGIACQLGNFPTLNSLGDQPNRRWLISVTSLASVTPVEGQPLGSEKTNPSLRIEVHSLTPTGVIRGSGLPQTSVIQVCLQQVLIPIYVDFETDLSTK
ncbi:MAG: hypothetical protein JWM16_5833 [Verrucomicrobiales bacterium]|nr:hypothetical protein [Verrucomicrobiales bacterium]